MQWLVKSVSSSFSKDLSHDAKYSTLKAKAKTNDIKIVLEDPRWWTCPRGLQHWLSPLQDVQVIVLDYHTIIWQIYNEQLKSYLQFFSEYPAMGVHPLLLEWHGSVTLVTPDRRCRTVLKESTNGVVMTELGREFQSMKVLENEETCRHQHVTSWW